MESPAPVQRLRVLFGRGEEIKYISHLDLMRMWERVFRRAGVPLAYSQGFNPQPRIALAAPLPVGMTSRGEIMDIWLVQPLSSAEFKACVIPQLPPGAKILDVYEVSSVEPSLQSQLRWAEYTAVLKNNISSNEAMAKVAGLLAAKELPREWVRQKTVKRYDLRPFILDLSVENQNGSPVLMMRLKADASGSGRPEEVLSALGLSAEDAQIERTKLGFEGNN